jgi:ABC-type hemin transport system ATPase subunit
VLVVEHDVPLILQTCDRIVALDFGRKIAEDTPDAISHDVRVIEAYLGTEDATSLHPAAAVSAADSAGVERQEPVGPRGPAA